MKLNSNIDSIAVAFHTEKILKKWNRNPKDNKYDILVRMKPKEEVASEGIKISDP